MNNVQPNDNRGRDCGDGSGDNAGSSTQVAITALSEGAEMTSDNFAQCVEHINVLTLRLKNADERCGLLAANLRRVKAECASQHSSSVPPPPPLLLTTMMKGGAGSISGSMSLPTAGSVTPPVLQIMHLSTIPSTCISSVLPSTYFLSTPLYLSFHLHLASTVLLCLSKKVRQFCPMR